MKVNEPPARVPAARGLFVAWQLAKNRAAELFAGDRGGFCPGGRGEEGDGVSGWRCGKGARDGLHTRFIGTVQEHS